MNFILIPSIFLKSFFCVLLDLQHADCGGEAEVLHTLN